MTSADERRSGGAGERRAYTGRTRRVHYDSCIYIRSKNIRALCRRAPPGISSENNILMYIRPLFLRLSPRPLPRSPSSLPFGCVSVSRAYSLPVAPPLGTNLHIIPPPLPHAFFLSFSLIPISFATAASSL